MKENGQKKSQIKQNILLYLEKMNISEYKFYKESGITRGILQQPNGISEDNIARFLDYAPDINITWLLTGKGDMLKTNQTQTSDILSEGCPDECLDTRKATKMPSITQELNIESTTETRPRIPLEAAAGSLSLFTQSVTSADCEHLPVVTRLPKYDFTIMVKGDSMEPNFKSGDEVACRMVREGAYIQWGQPHIIDSYDGIVLKRIHDKGDQILCTSDNPNFGNFYIPKSDINHLALVVGLIRLF